MHHAQTFSGNRYIELRSTDYYFGALILYALFAAMFIPYLYIFSQIWTNSNSLHCSAVESSDTFLKMKMSFKFLFTNQKHSNNSIGYTHEEHNNFVKKPNIRLSTPISIFTKNPSSMNIAKTHTNQRSQKTSKQFNGKKSTKKKMQPYSAKELVCLCI